MSLSKRKYPSTSRMTCPNCSKKIEYYRLSGMGQVFPHFYCNKCSNVYYNKQDRDVVMKNKLTVELFNKIVSALPLCSCGGCFCPTEGPRCPHCSFREKREKDIVKILTEPHAIIINGFSLIIKKNIPWIEAVKKKIRKLLFLHFFKKKFHWI